MEVSGKTALFIGLSYCSFLRGGEKLLLAKKLKDIKDLAALSLTDISALIGRALRTKTWGNDLIEKTVEDSVKIINGYDIKIVSFFDNGFPPQLREIPNPPLAVFYRGVLPDTEKPSVAMVGTRHPTGEGINAALVLARQFAEKGITVISGLAYGIDTFSHRGALEGLGSTAAVLACGVESIYPRTNKRLAAHILESGGCIISEYPPGTEPLQFRFPERNRIISGLSRSVVIVEAPEKSGALITGNFALEQGRDVFVCGSVLESLRNAGCRRFKEDGALVIDAACDVLNEWNYVSVKKEKINTRPLLGM